jgi:two-component system, OmpR family, response regulator VicR
VRVLAAVEDTETMDKISSIFNVCFPESSLIITRSGSECLCLMNKNKPDVIILDSNLDDGNGFEVLKKIRDINNQPVLMLLNSEPMSIKNDAQTLEAIELGADCSLTKPFRSIEFAAWVRALAYRNQSKTSRLAKIDNPEEKGK